MRAKRTSRAHPSGIVERCDHPGCKRWGCFGHRHDTAHSGYASNITVTLKTLWNFATTDRHILSRIVELLASLHGA